MADKPSQPEERYYEALVAETAREAVKPGKTAEEVDALLNKIIDRNELHEKQMERFRRDVYKRVEELRKSAKTDQEKKIITDYEGRIKKAGGKLRPAGVQEKFKFRVRAGKFEIGNICRRVWGHSMDADNLDGLMRDIQKLEHDIEQNKIELDMLKAAREATSTIIGSERLGLAVTVTKASLVKEIYKNKLKAKGWRSIFSTEMNLLESYRAARELKETHEAEYREGEKKVVPEIEERSRELEKKKAVLEAALKRVEELRKHGKELFDRAFGPQLQALLKNREMMAEEDYNVRVDALRKKVADFGRDAGITYMKYFLNQALGVKPEILEAEEKPLYMEPRTELENARERVRVAAWWKGNFLKEASKNEISGFIDRLRKEDPAFLQYVMTKKPDETDDEERILQFLFTGRCPPDKEILSSTRRADLNVDNVVKYLKIAKEVNRKYQGSELEKILAEFAERWPAEYKAEDFEYIYPVVLKETEKRPDLNKKRLQEVAPVWEALTGQKLPSDQPAKVDELYAAISRDARIKSGPDVFMEQLRGIKNEDEKGFMRFFFTGKFADTTYITDKNLLISADPAVFLVIHEFVHKFFEDHKPTAGELKQLCQKLTGRKKKFRDSGGLKGVPTEDFLKLLAKIRKPVPGIKKAA